tara:strand:- start:299 stop:613 length:315 start_codon:yes stop_codon:yes gene_type:complete
MDLTIYNKDGEKIIDQGKEICNKNQFFNDLKKIMSNPDFRKFIDKYCSDIIDTKTSISFIKQWQDIETEYKNKTDSELNPFINVFLLHYIWTNNEVREKLKITN